MCIKKERWEKNKPREYEDASIFTNYHKVLKDEILTSLKNNAHYIEGKNKLIDIGAGTGNFSRLLSPYLKSITLVDINKKPLCFLKKCAEQDKLTNLNIINKNYYHLKNTVKYDFLLLSLFGNPSEDDIKKLFSFVKYSVIIITNTYKKARDIKSIELEKRLKQKPSKDIWIKYLKENDYKYSIKNYTLEFGQPVKTIKDAENFLSGYYEKPIVEKKLKSILKINENFIKKNKFNNKNKFKYYIPNKKNISILTIELK